MIEIKEVCPLNIEELSGTYGYFSLGIIEITSNDFTSYFGYTGVCVIEGGQTFKIRLYRLGFSSKFVVLSDFSKIPDIAVIQADQVLKEIEEALEKKKKEEINVWGDDYYTTIPSDTFQYINIPYASIDSISTTP